MSQAEFKLCDDGTNAEVPVIQIDAPTSGGQQEQKQSTRPSKPFRCPKCMGYMCVYTQFYAAGHQARCHLCGTMTDVDGSHFGPVNEKGKRFDGVQHPEFKYGTFEYQINNFETFPKQPSFVFCLDISKTSIDNGFFAKTIESIKLCLDYFPNPDTELCFMTFDKCIQYYDVPMDPNGEPTILWVGETQDPFVPFPREKLMLNVTADRERIDAFLDKLITMYHFGERKNVPNQSCLGAAMSSGVQVFNKHGGRVVVFTSSLSNQGVGQLKDRNDPKTYN